MGLHPHDVARMNELLLKLRDKGNTVLVVEHNPEVMAVADHIVDMGPGAGSHGGEIVYTGTYEGLRGSDTLTGRHLETRQELKDTPRSPSGAWRSGVRAPTTSAGSTSTSPPGCWWPSPVWPAPARAR